VRRKIVVAFVATFCLLVWYRSLSAPGVEHQAKKIRQEIRGGERAAVPIEAVEASIGEIEDIVELTGEVEPAQESRVMPRVSGYLTEVLVRQGDRVSVGKSVVATIDSSELLLEEKRATAALHIAEATLSEKKVSLQEFKSKLAREQALFKQKVSAQEALDAAVYRNKTAGAALRLADAQLDRSRAELALASLRVAHTRVMTPFDGIVSARHLDAGAQVTPASAIVTLVDLSTVRVTGEVTERDYGRIREWSKDGLPIVARIRVASAEGVIEGVVHSIAPVFNRNTRTATVEVDVDNSNGALLPGMFARVGLVLRRIEGALVAPIQAIVERDGVVGSYVVRDGSVQFQEVERGIITRDRVQILEGLQPGEMLATTGNHLLTNGSRVKIVDQAEMERTIENLGVPEGVSP